MWPTTIEVIFVVLLGLPIYFYYELRYNHRSLKIQLEGSLWMLVYLIFISAISYLGSKGFGGINWIPYPYDFLVIIIASIFFYYWAVASRVDGEDLEVAKAINDKVKIN